MTRQLTEWRVYLIWFMVPDGESIIIRDVWQQENWAKSWMITSSTRNRKQEELDVRQDDDSQVHSCDTFPPTRLYLPKFHNQTESLTGEQIFKHMSMAWTSLIQTTTLMKNWVFWNVCQMKKIKIEEEYFKNHLFEYFCYLAQQEKEYPKKKKLGWEGY